MDTMKVDESLIATMDTKLSYLVDLAKNLELIDQKMSYIVDLLKELLSSVECHKEELKKYVETKSEVRKYK